MRTTGMVMVMATALLGACAARAKIDTIPRHYDCGGALLVARPGTAAFMDGGTVTPLANDDEVDRYVVLRGDERLELDVPRDRFLDAVLQVTPTGHRDICISAGGYTDALLRYMHGATTDEVARQLGVERREAWHLIMQALARLRDQASES